LNLDSISDRGGIASASASFRSTRSRLLASARPKIIFLQPANPTYLETETVIIRSFDEIALEETDINPSIVVDLAIRAGATHVFNL
jgi:hypothetical protein